MKSNKTDHRSKFTQMIIKDALLILLKDKPLNKIGVSELCIAAQVNRGTFYNHFYDVFDVYETIENELIDEVKKLLENIKNCEMTKAFFKEIMVFLYKNRELVSLIINSKNSSDFLKRVLDFAKNKLVSEWSKNYQNIPHEHINNIFTFTFNGSIGIITEWVLTGSKEPLDEIVDIIEKITGTVMQSFF